MLEAWIPIAIAAAFFQNLRSALQKHLKGKLSNSGAGYARFLYALPLAILYLWAISAWTGSPLPTANLRFVLYCIAGGVAQIIFTVLLLWMFSFRSFAVGTTFSKLEVVMVAALGALILGDGLSSLAVLAVAISAVGVVALSMAQTNLSVRAFITGLSGRDTLVGLVCASFLGASVVFFRGASLALQHDNVLMSAAFTLAVALVIQNIVMGLWLWFREPGEIGRVFEQWRWAGLVGVTGILASIGWFTAFTLQNASYVRAVGQIELIFTFIVTTRVFKESVSRFEMLGIVLVVAGIVLILLAP